MRRITAAVFLLVLCLFQFLPQPAEASSSEDMPTMKVGVMNDSIYAYQDAQGVWRGFDVECMINIAQRGGFRVEFIDSSKDSDFMGNLGNGTYDIVADAVKTEEREAGYLFTDTAIGSSNSTLAVRSDDEEWDYGNLDQISKMRIGVLPYLANDQEFRIWCRQHKLTPEIREYASMDEMTAALESGEIDGEVYLTLGAGDASSVRTILRFLPESFYYAFRKDDTELKNKVDSAISRILAENPDYLMNLKNKYENQFGMNILPLSAAEKEYVLQHPEMRVAVLKNDEPYYKVSADGTAGGILPDYFRLAADYSGLSFSYTAYDTQDQAIAALKNGEVDAIGVFSSGMVSSYQSGVVLTAAYSISGNVLIMKAETNASAIRKVAIKKRSSAVTEGGFAKYYRDVEITGYENASDCMAALSSGKEDAALLGMTSSTWLLNQTNATAYSVIPLSGVNTEMCTALRPGQETLCSILNKSIAATRNSYSGIVTNDTLQEKSLRTTVSRIPPTILSIVVCVLLILIIGLVWALILLRRRQMERTAVQAARAETQLQKVQVEAMRENAEQRNAFFSNISHDMRTPLNAVTGFIRLARKKDITPEMREMYLDKADSSSRLLLDLINDTLIISKSSSGKMELHLQPCRTSEMTEAVATPIRDAAAEKKIHFTADVSAMPDEMIMADRLNIEKIFLNLLSNAVQYTPAGGKVRYTVVLDRQEGRKRYYTIKVKDSGIGIDEEFLPHVFEAFSQEKRHGYESVGTGLGLSIVKQLVDLMGGSIEIQSRKNEGTEFTVHLHFETAENSDAADEDEVSFPEDALKGQKILICEDNALNREIAEALLHDRGIETSEAENGKAGLKLFSESAEGEFDAILMDVRMPVMGGIDAAAAIRKLNRKDAKTVPIIAMTADAFAEDVQKCMDAGMNGYLSKPVDPEKLYRMILKTEGQKTT